MTVSYDTNIFLNTLTYDIEFSDGDIKEWSANVIAENMHSQVDEDGRNIQILDSIVDYRKDTNALHKTDARTRTKRGYQRLRQKISG